MTVWDEAELQAIAKRVYVYRRYVNEKFGGYNGYDDVTTNAIKQGKSLESLNWLIINDFIKAWNGDIEDISNAQRIKDQYGKSRPTRKGWFSGWFKD